MKFKRTRASTQLLMTAATSLAAVLSFAQAALAAPLLFSYTEAGLSTRFVLDSNPMPMDPFVHSFSAMVTEMSVSVGMSPAIDYGAVSVSFSDDVGGGGFQAIAYDMAGSNLVMVGLPLFAGGTGGVGPNGRQADPVFSPGVFFLTDIDGTSPRYGFAGTLDITPLSAAPEPSTWALMLAGVGVAGVALRMGRVSRRA